MMSTLKKQNLKPKNVGFREGFTSTREGENENSFSFFPNAVEAKPLRDFTSTNENDANVYVRDVRVPSRQTPKGFTLIEMMVAVSLFAMVMLIGVGALLSLVETNRRAQAINSVVNNMNAALEGMSRSIRVGTTYHCRDSISFVPAAVLSIPQDCPEGGILLAFESSEGSRSDVDDQVVYRLNGTQLERSTQAGANGSWVALTAPEVTIDPDIFEFYVIGSTPKSSNGDDVQPRVLIKIKGSAPVPGGNTQFNVQAGITQRIIDI